MNPRPRLINPLNPEAPLYHTEITSSTMTLAAELAKDGCPHGTAIQADLQTKGRGRFVNRSWESQKGRNLLFTLVLHTDFLNVPLSAVPVICGLSVAAGIRKVSGLNALVKWPNDVLINDKKVCGILCELKGKSILAGIGINVNQEGFSGDYSWPPSSLSIISGLSYSLEELLIEVLHQLHENQVTGLWQERINSVLYKRGEQMCFSKGLPESGNSITGKIKSIDKDGALILLDSFGQEQVLMSGEASFSSQKC